MLHNGRSAQDMVTLVAITSGFTQPIVVAIIVSTDKGSTPTR
jgi:hypothetical protein